MKPKKLSAKNNYCNNYWCTREATHKSKPPGRATSVGVNSGLSKFCKLLFKITYLQAGNIKRVNVGKSNFDPSSAEV